VNAHSLICFSYRTYEIEYCSLFFFISCCFHLTLSEYHQPLKYSYAHIVHIHKEISINSSGKHDWQMHV
jgi:hypothetical protein